MKVIRRFTPCDGREVRVDERDGAAPKINGYAAVFYDGTPATEYRYYDVVERIMPGAFSFALPKSDVRGLFNHDPNFVLGRNKAGTLVLTVDAVGLRYVIAPPKSSIGNDVLESLRRRDVTGSSFAFTVDKKGQTWTRGEDGNYVREIISVAELFDVGPVTYPAYTATEAVARSMGEPENLDEFKAAARAAAGAAVDAGNAEALRAAHIRAGELRRMALTDLL